MKLSNYFFIFLTILTLSTVVMYFTTDLNVTISREDQKYRESLYMATGDALETVMSGIEKPMNSDVLWTPENMQKAREALNSHFELQLNYPINSKTDTTDWLFPILCYMDYNGFYVTYVGTENDGTAAYKKVTSDINAWTRTMDSYAIQYYLGKDILTVINPEGLVFTGTYNEVNEYFNYPNFLKSYTLTKEVDGEEIRYVDAKAFNKDKEDYIITKTEELLNYYLNNKDTTIAKLGKHIELNFDRNDDAFHKMFHNVGFIVFLQGPVMNNFYSKTPIYGYAHYQVIESKSDVIVTLENNNLYYHNDDCSIIDAQTIVSKKTSIKEAALIDATYCPHCH